MGSEPPFLFLVILGALLYVGVAILQTLRHVESHVCPRGND